MYNKAMTRILLVRHGETEANKLKIVQGRGLDYELNETGLDQARQLARRLKDIKIDHIFTSPQRRAYQTAEAVSGFHPNTPLTVRFDLAETGMGRLEGVHLDVVKNEFPESDWDKEDFRQQIGGESFEYYQRHFTHYLPSWLKQHDGQTILISTHGGKLKAILRKLVREEYQEAIRNSHPTNTSVTEVEWTPETGGHIVFYNDNSHLTQA